ncbi:hypothetical protein ACHQM5_013665 [Ranunculus cassubicifolius]
MDTSLVKSRNQEAQTHDNTQNESNGTTPELNSEMEVGSPEDTQQQPGTEKSVVIGKMKVSKNRVELYTRLIEQFGELVPTNLSKYKVAPVCGALNVFLDAVSEMMVMAPEKISENQVSDWEEMIVYFVDMGLNVDWLHGRVRRFCDWFAKQSSDLDQMEWNIGAVKQVLGNKRYEVEKLERELQMSRDEVKDLEGKLKDLEEEYEVERNAFSELNFTFMYDYIVL